MAPDPRARPHRGDGIKELTTVNALLQLGEIIVAALLTVGPLLGVMLLLNLRDRRQATLLSMMWQLTPKDLSDLIAIRVRCAVISRRGAVTVDMLACSREEIWEAITRWSPNLPPHVRLLVNGKVDPGLQASFRIETTCRQPRCCPPRPSVVAG